MDACDALISNGTAEVPIVLPPLFSFSNGILFKELILFWDYSSYENGFDLGMIDNLFLNAVIYYSIGPPADWLGAALTLFSFSSSDNCSCISLNATLNAFTLDWNWVDLVAF